MVFQNKRKKSILSVFVLFNLFFCFISSPIFATDWDKVKKDGDKAIDDFYNVNNDDSYAVTLENLFYPKLSEKNKKEPIPIEKLMKVAKDKIEACGEKATEDKVKKKFIELILIQVFRPLTQKLDGIIKENNINYEN